MDNSTDYPLVYPQLSGGYPQKVVERWKVGKFSGFPVVRFFVRGWERRSARSRVMAIDMAWIEQVLDEGKAETLASLCNLRHYHFITDTISEMELWACFRHPSYATPPTPEPVDQPAAPPKKVGRNDPCPCGSGIKYKYCCGKRY